MAVSRRTVTVLFADVADSTPLGERLDPESLRLVMSRWFERMSEVLERHGGTVEKFIGDAVMAVFGIPELHEDDALRAVRAASELRAALVQLNDELGQELGVHIGIRVGVNTGEVVAGDGTGGQMLVTGDPVNVAKRLEEAARTGEILLGETTRRLVENATILEPRDELTVKGKAGPVLAWNAVAVIEGAPAYARRLDAPLVGRASELQALRDAFAAAVAERSCKLVTLLGPAGIGKSRLAAELRHSLREEAQTVTGRCLPYGDGITFWPLVQMIGSLGGDDGVREALAGAEDAELVAERVLSVVGPTGTTTAGGETFWAVRRLLEEGARQAPLVVMVEDIHWAAPTLLDLLEYLAGWTHDAPVLLLCLSRPDLIEERPSWLNAPNSTAVVLEPLTDAEADTLLDELAQEWPLDPDARQRIKAAAEGNPLYVEQMAATLAEGGPLDSIPPSIHALLSARLDRLPPDERAVLERAAVAGKEFVRKAVLQLSDDTKHEEVDGLLLKLARKDLLAARPGREDAYRFRHVLIRDAAYAGIAKEQRAQLHERFGNWAIGTALGRAGDIDEIIGYHYEQAFKYRMELGPITDESREFARRGSSLLQAAGRRAAARGDAPASANLLRRALALLPENDARRLDLMLAVAEALTGTGSLSEAKDLLDEVKSAADKVGDRRVGARAVLDTAFTQLHTWEGKLEPLLPLSADAARVFEAAGDDEGMSKALMLRAYVTFICCRFAETIEIVDRALVHAHRADNRRMAQDLLYVRARAALRGPTPVEEAIELCTSISNENAGDQGLDAFIRGELAVLAAMRGQFDEARELAAEAEKILMELGRTLALAAVRADSGAVEMLAGNTAAAASSFRTACDTMESIGERGNLSSYAAFLAEALVAEGDEAEATRYSALSEETALTEDVLSQVLWRAARARLLSRSGELDEARTLAEAAVKLAEETDDLNLTADAWSTLGSTLAAAGAADEARPAHARAAELYERKGNVVSAEQAQALASGSTVQA